MIKAAMVDDSFIEKVIIVGNVERTVTTGMGKKMYSWSKYGGANFGLVQENKTEEWSCQACGESQLSELPAYMFEFSENEFMRICSICQAKKLINHIKTLDELLSQVRKIMDPWY